MSGTELCVTGATLTDPDMCAVLNDAKTEPLEGPTVTPPTPVADELMPAAMKDAIAECTGTSSCKFIGYDFDSGVATKVSASQYVVDTYSTTIENSGVLVLKGETAPPMLVEPPGYELPDFQAASTTPSNLIDRPVVSSVEECAAQCDNESQCTGFNFGGIDTSSICELVRDTTNRAYADGMSGFRKETISRRETGDDVPGTDITNQGLYCRDAPACNTDIARIITDNVGAANPIESLSTSDIESCAYCPIRTYARTGISVIPGVVSSHVTTNEFGVSKPNLTASDAINELQYQTDGTNAEHDIVIQPGKFYKLGTIVVFTVESEEGFKLYSMFRPPFEVADTIVKQAFEVPIVGFLSQNMTFVPSRYLVTEWSANGFPVTTPGEKDGSMFTDILEKLKKAFSTGLNFDIIEKPDIFTFNPVPFVTNGFRIVSISDGKAITGRQTKSEYTLFSKDSVFQVSETNIYEFVNQLEDYPGILYKFDSSQYLKINSNGTADIVPDGQYPFTSEYSSSFTFCRTYTLVSFDFAGFEWSQNWFTQKGASSCEKEVTLKYVYRSALMVANSINNSRSIEDIPGFWNSITTICSVNNCQAGTYTPACTSTTPNVRQCITCSPGSYCPQYATSEEPCPDGYYCPTPSSKITCGSAPSCPTGYVAVFNNWVDPGCRGTHSATNNRTIDTSYTCTFQACPANYIKVGSVCEPCLHGGTSNGGETSCLCNQNTIGTNWRGARCELCPSGSYISGPDVCQNCPEGAVSEPNSNRCLCPERTAWTGPNYNFQTIIWADMTVGDVQSCLGSICVPNPNYVPGYAPPQTGTTGICAYCKPEFYPNLCNGTAIAQGATSTYTQSCLAGEYLLLSAGTCTPCSEPTGFQYTTSVCTLTQNTGFGTFSGCSTGQFVSSATNIGSSSVLGSSTRTCSTCPAGSYCADTFTRSYCPHYTYSTLTGQTSSTVCKPCGSGTRTDVVGSASCLCKSGYTNLVTAADGTQTCSALGTCTCTDGSIREDTYKGYICVKNRPSAGTCPDATWSSYSMGQCWKAATCACPTGYTGTNCENCAQGYTWNGSACVSPISRFTQEWGVRNNSKESVQVGVPQLGLVADCAKVCVNTPGCKAFQMDWRNAGSSGDSVVGSCVFFSTLTTKTASGAMAVYKLQ